MEKQSALEAGSGNVGTKVAANAFAVLFSIGTPLAAFVPFLVDSLASGRQAQRVEKMFGELSELINAHSDQLKALSDDQYKVVSEAISAAFYTISAEKISLLKRTAANAFLNGEIVEKLSDPLSRVVRDISAAEASFVIRNFGYESFMISAEALEPPDLSSTLIIRPHSNDEVIVAGLINLGLLYSKKPKFDVVAYEWSPLVATLIRLIKE